MRDVNLKLVVGPVARGEGVEGDRKQGAGVGVRVNDCRKNALLICHGAGGARQGDGNGILRCPQSPPGSLVKLSNRILGTIPSRPGQGLTVRDVDPRWV